MTAPHDQQPPAVPSVIILPPPAAQKQKPKRRRAHVKRCRYDDAELAEFEARAQASGLSEGAYNRLCTIGDAGPRAKRSAPTADMKLLGNLMTELNHLGSNQNQTTRGYNQFLLIAREAGADRLELILTDAIADSRALSAKIAEVLAAVLRALGYDS